MSLYVFISIQNTGRSIPLVESKKLYVSLFNSYAALPSTLFFYLRFFTVLLLFIDPLTVANPTFHLARKKVRRFIRGLVNCKWLQKACNWVFEVGRCDRQTVGSKLKSSVWLQSAIRSSMLVINAFINGIPIARR